ncbi:MAG TPA: response regulator, partial [Anaerolineaceae bacterium]|nr:response regulator [Anaerolineaceae bacterium]
MAKILLVEDNVELVGIIRRELNTAGYEVVDCADGKTALELVASRQPDAILLDWMLPELDGVEV